MHPSSIAAGEGILAILRNLSPLAADIVGAQISPRTKKELFMFRMKRITWSMLLAANVVSLCVLGFYGRSEAAPKRTNEPFANSVEQRFEIIRQLQQINDQLKEQNALLKSGKLQVVVDVSNSR